MQRLALNTVYADPRAAACVGDHLADHRERVQRALLPGEPILAFWWADVSGLVLATDRRLIQFPKLLRRRLFMGYDVLFETWTHPYHTLTTFERLPGGLFELPRVVVHKADGSQVAIMVGKMDEAASEAFLATVQTLITQRVNGEPLPVEPAPEAAADAEDRAARLAALADLHAAGALTDEEYARARDRLDQG